MDGRFKGLDLLRLFAVLFVLLFHYAYRGAMGQDGFTRLSVPEWHFAAQYGYLGVHLFFVISGVVIAKSTEGRGPLAFALARFIRIYPAFLICMTISCVVTVMFGAPEFTAGLGTWVANLPIFAPALHQPFVDGAYWSIVYEIVYEIVFYGWVMVLLNGRLLERHVDAIALCWIALSIGNEYLGPSLQFRRLFLTDASGFFLCGIVIYRLQSAGSSLRNWVLLGLATELAAGQAVITSRYNVVHYGAKLSEGVIIAVAVCSIVLVGLCTRLKHDLVPRRVALAIGGATYPLYLLHQNIGYIAFDRLGARFSPEHMVLATAALMVLAALAIHRLVEKPLQAGLKRVLTVESVSRLRRRLSRSKPVLAPWTDRGRGTAADAFGSPARAERAAGRPRL